MTNNGDQEKYSKGEVLSMLESINDGIKVIGEQHGGIVKRLDGIDGRLDGIDGRLDGIDGRLDSLETKTDRLQEDVTEIKHKLSEKVDREDFNNLEKRMVTIEKLVFAKLS